MSAKLNALLQYLQPTEFYTPVTYGKMKMYDIIKLYYFVAVLSLTCTLILPTFFKNKKR